MEIEIKVKIERSENLVAFLKKEATFVFTNRQIDEYYTPFHENFLEVDPIKEWLRLRDSDGKYSINYKSWHYNQDGKSNHCDEYETKVDDINAMRKILMALDFKHLVTVDKVRSVWDYKDYEISMDSVQNLADFVEIEYKGTDANPDPKKISDEMMDFLKKMDCGSIERDYKGYLYLLLKKD